MIGRYLKALVDPIVEGLPDVACGLGELPDGARPPALRIRWAARARGYGSASVLKLDAYALVRAEADAILDRALEALRKTMKEAESGEAGDGTPVWNLRLGELTAGRDKDHACMVLSAAILFEWETNPDGSAKVR